MVSEWELIETELIEQYSPSRRDTVPSIEQADGSYSHDRGGKFHQFLKRQKNRAERRKARQNPWCQPTYKGHRYTES